MAKRREIRNSTAEFLIFQIEGKESPIRNPVFPQFPRQPLYKEKLRILTKFPTYKEILHFSFYYSYAIPSFIASFYTLYLQFISRSSLGLL